MTVKQKFLALKLYLIGLAVGLFIFGWSAIARTDTVAATTTATTNNNQIASNQAAPDSTRLQRQLNLQPIPQMPRIRTRTS
ncbi:MAG: hypothetical protein HY870_17205 [Chloroflexi bacterium]|nr:hypothetical protein [Chloroflexota bacterium]